MGVCYVVRYCQRGTWFEDGPYAIRDDAEEVAAGLADEPAVTVCEVIRLETI